MKIAYISEQEGKKSNNFSVCFYAKISTECRQTKQTLVQLNGWLHFFSLKFHIHTQAPHSGDFHHSSGEFFSFFLFDFSIIIRARPNQKWIDWKQQQMRQKILNAKTEQTHEEMISITNISFQCMYGMMGRSVINSQL